MESTQNNRPMGCPHCSSRKVAWLAFMRRYHDLQDWFRCDRCGHIFCRPQNNARVSTSLTVHGSTMGVRSHTHQPHV